jgi:hypothetical protein
MQKSLKFYFHKLGTDKDGNNGPDLGSKGWVCVPLTFFEEPTRDAATYAAYNALSNDAQEHIKKALGKKSPKRLGTLIENESGIGMGFTLACDDWGEMGDTFLYHFNLEDGSFIIKDDKNN